MGRKRILTDEERIERKNERQRRWRAKNPEYYKKYYQANREKQLEYLKEYNTTPMGRAVYLVGRYCQSDKRYNRGDCTLTAEWMLENIFNKHCHYCGKDNWRELGCDRIDNSLPHTEDNVVPCCECCNKKRGRKSYEEFIEQLKKEDPQVN